MIAFAMLGRNDHCGAGHRLAVFIAQRNLALCVGLEEGCIAALAVGGQLFEDLVAVVEGRRHEIGRLVACESEHDALIACTFVLVAACIHALGDLG